MKIYIAAQSFEAAQTAGFQLRAAGHVVCSTWTDLPFRRTGDYTEEERAEMALRMIAEVRQADLLLLLAGQIPCPGGKFIEAGIAMGERKPVVVIGHRENMLLWAPSVQVCATVKIFLDGWRCDTIYSLNNRPGPAPEVAMIECRRCHLFVEAELTEYHESWERLCPACYEICRS